MSRVPALPELSLSLQFADASHRDLLPRHKVARWIRRALEAPGEITVRVVDAEEGQALNRDYRQKDYATNVLTFDYSHEPVVMADLVLCAPVVAREAKEMGLAVADHYAHLLVHGTLHAQGYDHEADDEAACMEGRETELMLAMGFADPYARKPAAKRALAKKPAVKASAKASVKAAVKKPQATKARKT